MKLWKRYFRYAHLHSCYSFTDKKTNNMCSDLQIPVYLSKSLAENLFILQYPNRKTNFNRTHVVNSSVKPLNQEVKIEFALDTASRHYDAFKGEQFALAADGKVSW